MTNPAVVVAFAAASVRTGRTSMVANQAWILASAGRRVLVLDIGTEGPELHDYLGGFDCHDELSVDALGADLVRPLTIATARPRVRRHEVDRPLRLRRYCLPELPVPVDVVGVAGDGHPTLELDPIWLSVRDAERLRAALTDCDYDHVLLDLPTGADPDILDLAARLADTAVVCLSSQRDAVGPARALVDELRRRAPSMAVVLAASVFAGAEHERRRDRDLVLRAFSPLLDGQFGITHIEIPYQPRHVADRTLAVLTDPPGDPTSLAAAYERLVAAVTSGDVMARGPVSQRLRTRYRLGLGIALPEPTETIRIASAPEDGVWADWITELLGVPGIDVRPLDNESSAAETVIVVLSDVFPTSAACDLLMAALSSPTARDLVTVRVTGDVGLDELLPGARTVDLSSADAEQARRALLSAVLLFSRPETGPADVAYPGAASFAGSAGLDRGVLPPEYGVPPRNLRFVGREDQLAAMRSALCPVPAPLRAGLQWLTLYGGSGVGKSELARAYVHRYGAGYDFVWWISATDVRLVRSRLWELASWRFQLPRGGDLAPVLAALCGRRADGRWLLVYDNATAESVDGSVLPTGGRGDVIITATDGIAGLPGLRLEIGGLGPFDSWQLLSQPDAGLRHLPEPEARAIGDALGHLPVALQLAAAWLRDRARLLERHYVRDAAMASAAGELSTLLHESPSAGGGLDTALRRMLGLTTALLDNHRIGALAVAIAEFCSFLQPDGVALRLLRSKPVMAMLAAAAGPAGELLLCDESELDRALWLGDRFGLFAVEQILDRLPGQDRAAQPAEGSRSAPQPRTVQRTVRLHRTIQRALRAGLDARGQLTTRQAQVLRGLAGFAPPSIDDHPELEHDFAELQRHLDQAGVAEVDYTRMTDQLGDAGTPGTAGWDVRRWLVIQLRYLYREHGADTWRAALALGNRIDASWVKAFGRTDGLRLRLAVQLANLHRGLGDYPAALALDTEVVAEQRRSLGIGHPRTLMTARGLGGDLRMVGRLDEALAEDEATWRGFREVLGKDHPDTLMVAFNLAETRYLSGRPAGAAELASKSYRRRLRLLGPDHREVWESRRNLGIYLGELGDYPRALAHLDSNVKLIRQYHGAHEHREELISRRAYLVFARRSAGGPDPTRSAAVERLLGRYRQRFGAASNLTRSCLSSFAVELNDNGHATRAAEHAAECVAASRDQLTDKHPFTLAHQVNLLRFQLAAGRLDQVLTDGPAVLSDLAELLDGGHPWVLAAATNHAGALARAGLVEEAEVQLESGLEEAFDPLGWAHPTVVAATANLELLARQSAGSADLGAWRYVEVFLP